jgi:hypothetical protein
MTGSRPHLLWFGQSPCEATSRACADRDVMLRYNPIDVSPADYSTARTLAIALGPEPASQEEGEAIEERLRAALRHGIKCIVLAPLGRIPEVQSAITSLPFGAQIELWDSNRESHVAERAARAQPGAAWSGTIDVTGDDSLCEEDRILLRRAFHDCTTGSLIAETQGRSAKVYRVFAKLRDSAAGRLPLPFFAKFDKYSKVKRELENYRDHTTLFIPFNQRPNVDPSRCFLGAERGLIVGNFVEESEPLGELVERGTARAALHSLFGGALRGWRTQSYLDETMAIGPSIVNSLVHCLPSAYRIGRRDQLVRCAIRARELDATLDPTQLEELLKRLPPLKHRRCMTHGDLHGSNVRVCRGEAILMDFASTQIGPLMADPASLEVSLAMDAQKLSAEDWSKFTREAYDMQNLRALPAPQDPARLDAALWNSIRQLRQIALADQLSGFEYATAVAIYMLRHASYARSAHEPAGRREMAYFLAERIATQLATELGRAAAD